MLTTYAPTEWWYSTFKQRSWNLDDSGKDCYEGRSFNHVHILEPHSHRTCRIQMLVVVLVMQHLQCVCSAMCRFSPVTDAAVCVWIWWRAFLHIPDRLCKDSGSNIYNTIKGEPLNLNDNTVQIPTQWCQCDPRYRAAQQKGKSSLILLHWMR